MNKKIVQNFIVQIIEYSPYHHFPWGSENGERFSITGRFSFNQINKFGSSAAPGLVYKSVDLLMRKSYADKSATFEPFTEVGGGYVFLGEDQSFLFNLGAGIAYWASDNIGLSYQVNYKDPFENRGVVHFQHQLGLNIKFGGVDTDGDGVYDKFDACPNSWIRRIKDSDTDGDGIIDQDDACPKRAGSAEMNGCPDSDGDGIRHRRCCLNRAGSVEMGGCPDTDADGISDKDDGCPEEPCKQWMPLARC